MKTVLTFTDGTDRSDHRLSAAIGLAGQLDAYLSVLAFGFEPDFAYADGMGGSLMAMPPSNARAESEEAAGKARDLIARAGIGGEAVPIVCLWGRFAREVGDAAQFADLVVLGRPYGEGAAFTEATALEGALFDGDGAVMLVPEAIERVPRGPALIAWNGSREALHAVRRAMPFLKKAPEVEITIIGQTPSETIPGRRLATWLSRHGVHSEVAAQVASRDSIAESLRRRVIETGTGLVVMGAYSHSRFREYILGGVTREFLADFPVPVLTAH